MHAQCIVFILAVMVAAAPVAARPVLQDAIVKIYTSSAVPDYYNPWTMMSSVQGTGSGCVIAGRKILSNAHVVSYQTFVQVRKHGDPRRYTARVLSVSHAADLAILTVEDPGFFDGIEPLELGDLPDPQDEVVVYGFPLGGDTLSITKGVLSRMEHQIYSHSSANLLAGQIDAAINPGNSGGPVLKDGRIVGVVMQGMTQAENIGYMVPVNIIRHFFRDLEDGTLHGIPGLGVHMQGLENPAMKKRFGLDHDVSGLLVTKVVPGSASDGILKPDDILLSVDGHAVADDGTVEYRSHQRTSMGYFIQEKQIADQVLLEVWREGTTVQVPLTLTRAQEKDLLIPDDEYDVMPSYYIYGGAVFCPLTRNLLKRWGGNWVRSAPPELVALLSDNIPEREDQQIVMLLKFMPADVNEGYHNVAYWIVDAVNDQPINNMRELIHAIEAGPENEFVEIESPTGGKIVFDRRAAAESHRKILSIYKIAEDRSGDLR